jgi:hypothetical protein
LFPIDDGMPRHRRAERAGIVRDLTLGFDVIFLF